MKVMCADKAEIQMSELGSVLSVEQSIPPFPEFQQK